MIDYNSDRSPLITPEVPALYKSTIKEVAATWNDETPEYSRGLPGSITHYEQMRNVLTNRMIAIDPDVERVAISIPNQAGFEVISRFFYTGAAKAALQGLSLTDLQGALYQPESFRQLIPLTRETNRAARRIEAELGLTDPSRPNLKEFALDENGLRITKYALHRYVTRANLHAEGHMTSEEAYNITPEDDPVRCAGLTSGLTTYAYKYMLEICMKDPSLFAATIEPGPTAS